MAKISAALIVCLFVTYSVAQQSPFGSNPAPSQGQQQPSGGLPPQQPKNEGPASPGSGSESPAAPAHDSHTAETTPSTTVAPGNGTAHQNGTAAPSHEKLTDKSGAASFVVASSLLMVVVAPIML